MMIGDMIADYGEALRQVSGQIAYLESGNRIHVPGKDSDQATSEWLNKLRWDQSVYRSILASLAAQMLNAAGASARS